MFTTQTYNEFFSVLSPRFIHRFHKLGVEIHPLPETVRTVSVPRLIDDIHLVAAVGQRNVTNSEIFTPQCPQLRFSNRAFRCLYIWRGVSGFTEVDLSPLNFLRGICDHGRDEGGAEAGVWLCEFERA